MKPDEKISISSSLGDITKLVEEKAVVDLSWLDVNEDDYRRLEALPKQNFDIIPELSGFFDGKEDTVSYQHEHTMVNSVPQSTPGYSSNENSSKVRNRFASFLTAGMKWADAVNRISLEFSPEEIGSSDIASLEPEYGLLGNVYIDSNHFEKCHSDKKVHALAAKANKSIYVLAKERCSGCVSNHNDRCGVLGHKILVSSVPYGPALARTYLPVLTSENKPLRISAESIKAPSFSWKETLRKAFLQDSIKWNPDGHQSFHTRLPVVPVKVSTADVARVLSGNNAPKPRVLISSEYSKISRAMMLGKDVSSHIASSQDPDVLRLSSLNGVFGKYIVDIDSFGSCEKASKVSSYPNVRYIRRNATCDSCAASGCPCSVGLSVSSTIPEIGEPELKHFLASKVEKGHISSQLSSRILLASKGKSASGFINKLSGFYLTPGPHQYSGDASQTYSVSSKPVPVVVDTESMVRTIASIINSGTPNVKEEISSTYAKEEIAALSAEDVAFIRNFSVRSAAYFDPSIYDDFGRGCNQGSKVATHRRRTEKHLKLIAADKCVDCTSRVTHGWCSRYSMNISNETIEDQTRVASSIINKRNELVQLRRKASLSVPIKNEVQEFDVRTTEIAVEMDKPKADDIEITFSGEIE